MSNGAPIHMKSGAHRIAIPTFNWHDFSKDWSWFSFQVTGELAAYQAAYEWRHNAADVKIENNGTHDIWTVIIEKRKPTAQPSPSSSGLYG